MNKLKEWIVEFAKKNINAWKSLSFYVEDNKLISVKFGFENEIYQWFYDYEINDVGNGFKGFSFVKIKDGWLNDWQNGLTHQQFQVNCMKQWDIKKLQNMSNDLKNKYHIDTKIVK